MYVNLYLEWRILIYKYSMERESLNVQMFSTKDCQDIIDEIKNEYGRDLRFVQPRERFFQNLKSQFEKFDFISRSLVINGKTSVKHLVQRGTRFGLFCGYDISIEWPIEFLQINQQGEDGGLMALNENLKWGIPERKGWNGKMELPFEFEDINACTGCYYPVKFQGKWGIYHAFKNEMVIEPQYDDAKRLCEGLWAVSMNGKWGFVDIFNHVVIPFEYNSVSNFINGYAHAIKSFDTNIVNNILLDHNGRETSFRNESLLDDHYRSRLKIETSYVDHVEYYFVVGPDNKILTPKNRYRYLGRYSEGLFAASLDGETYGYIDINENIVIPFIYKLGRYIPSFWRNDFQWGIICVRLDEGYGYDWIIINHKNEQVFPYFLHDSSYIKYENGSFGSSGGWSGIGDRFKSFSINIYDLINYNRGKDMSYLIRTNEEINIEKQRKKNAYRNQEPYEWTEEDTWDAMTDGMYGDYPGGDVDYEVLGF